MLTSIGDASFKKCHQQTFCHQHNASKLLGVIVSDHMGIIESSLSNGRLLTRTIRVENGQSIRLNLDKAGRRLQAPKGFKLSDSIRERSSKIHGSNFELQRVETDLYSDWQKKWPREKKVLKWMWLSVEPVHWTCNNLTFLSVRT